MLLGMNNTRVTLELNDLITQGVKVWDFEYPSFYQDEQKEAFEQKVLDHYRFRQIGQETVGRFLHCFRTKVREIMPYYIQLYESEALFKSIPDPLQSYDLTETYERTQKGSSSATSEGASSSEASNTRRFSDTPQGRIENLDTHLTEATKEGGTGSEQSTGSSASSSEGSEEYTLRRVGNIGVQPLGQELRVLREAFLNIDMMIINELNDLFLMVY